MVDEVKCQALLVHWSELTRQIASKQMVECQNPASSHSFHVNPCLPAQFICFRQRTLCRVTQRDIWHHTFSPAPRAQSLSPASLYNTESMYKMPAQSAFRMSCSFPCKLFSKVDPCLTVVQFLLSRFLLFARSWFFIGLLQYRLFESSLIPQVAVSTHTVKCHAHAIPTRH